MVGQGIASKSKVIWKGEKQTAIENNKCFLGPQVYSCDQKQVKVQWNKEKNNL